jgi:hypothetical protein
MKTKRSQMKLIKGTRVIKVTRISSAFLSYLIGKGYIIAFN